MKHQDFRGAAIGEAFETIEGVILPSLTHLIDTAAGAQPGMDAEVKAGELRDLARQLDELRALFEGTHFN